MSIRFFPELCRIFPAYLFGPTPLSFGWKSYHRFSLTPVRSESRRSLLRDTSANDNRIWCLATPSRFLDKQIREITTFNFIDISRVFFDFSIEITHFVTLRGRFRSFGVFTPRSLSFFLCGELVSSSLIFRFSLFISFKDFSCSMRRNSALTISVASPEFLFMNKNICQHA